jgi:putative tricarboxylic transport membrane protein
MIRDIVTGAVAVGISVFVYFTSVSIESGGASLSGNPALYPRILAAVVFLLGVLLILQAIVKSRRGEKLPAAFNDREALGRVGKMLTVLCLYVVGIYFVGFIFPTLLFSFFMPLISGSRLKTALLVSLPVTVALYVVFFIFFKVPIPHGILFR